MVNHIANKQIEHKRQRKQAMQAAREMQLTQSAETVQQLPQSAANKAVKSKTPVPKTAAPAVPVKQEIPEEEMTETPEEPQEIIPSSGTNPQDPGL